MSSLYKNYKMDTEKQSSGIPVHFEPNDDKSVPTFIVCRMDESNKEYMKALDIATKPYRRQIDLKILPKEKDEEIFVEVFVNSILQGWTNVQGEDGSSIPFSKGNAIKLFTDLPEVLKELRKAASDVALFRSTALDDEAKN